MGSGARLTAVGASPTLAPQHRKISGSSSGVERKLPKLDVAGSIPVSRSIIRLAHWVGRIFLFFPRYCRQRNIHIPLPIEHLAPHYDT